ncbi:MAG: RNA polymerase sigma factor [Balneolaceae bacterium]
MKQKPTDRLSDEVLISRYQQGEEAALKLLIRRFHPRLVRFVRSVTRHGDASEDIAQQCWEAMLPQLAELNIAVRFEAWACTIARRKSVDWIRHRQRERKLGESLKNSAELDEKPTEEWNQDEKLNRVHTAIQLLPATQKRILELFYLDHLNLREIARLLDIPQGTVKSRLFHAREHLKEIINPT